MPKRGRNKNFSRIKKEKKAIETRLIQISLVMDDYVYKHKDITVAEADEYIQEISAYKNKCTNNPRSLQVIEKLIKCMKSIINTHKDTQDKCNLFNTNNIDCQAVCPSPVNLLADVDKELTITSQSNGQEHNTDLMETDECVEVIDLCNEIEEPEEKQSNKKVNKTVKEVKPSNERKLITIIEERRSPERNIKDFDVKKATTVTTDEGINGIPAYPSSPESSNSQSILNNKQNSENQDLITAYSQVAGIPDKNNCQDPYSHNNNENQLLVTTPLYNIFTEIDYSQGILSNSGNIETEELVDTHTQRVYAYETNNSQKIKSLSKYIENKTMVSSVSGFQKEKCATDKAKHNKNILSETNHQELVTLRTSKISDVTDKNIPDYYIMKPVANNISANIKTEPKKKRAPRKKKIDVPPQETSNSKNVKRKPRKKNTPKTNTGKDNKLDGKVTSDSNNSIDFSWIENIKYVREISTTESHTRSKDLSLSFWENYSLPDDWDDSEFMYDT